jgi:hypothetical protein
MVPPEVVARAEGEARRQLHRGRERADIDAAEDVAVALDADRRRPPAESGSRFIETTSR